MTKQVNDFKGFGLFNDIEDQDLRNRNRAVVLANIATGNINKEKKVSVKGASLVLGYFSCIPEGEREDVRERFVKNMKDRGFALVG